MDYNDLLDRISKAEADLAKFSEELLERRLNGDGISESITTNAMIAHSSLYITRLAFERTCKKLKKLEDVEKATETKEDPVDGN